MKKIIGLLLCMTLAFTTPILAYSDVEEGIYVSEAITILSNFNVLNGYEDGTFKPEATVTRAEMAKIICEMLGNKGLGKSDTVFTDVPNTHWASGYISTINSLNVINGYGDGTYGPEDTVKYKDAIKMVVAALGYNPVAEVNGGYPGGYQVIASSTGILNNITGVNADEFATRGVIAQMVYNSLTVPMMTQTGFGTNTSYGYSNETVLNKVGITKFYGSVYATSLSDYENIKEGTVKLKVDKQFTAIADQSQVAILTPNTDTYEKSANPYVEFPSNRILTVKVSDDVIEDAAKDLLDYATVFYVKDAADDENRELVAIVKRGNRNAEVEFVTEDIYDKKTDVKNEIYVFTDKENDKYDKYKIDIEKLYVNNVEYVGNDVKDKFASYISSTKSADIRLLNNSADGDDYTIAYVMEYTDYIVEDIRESDYKLYSDNAGTLILDEEEIDYNFTIYKDGEKVSFDAITVGDVVSVAGVINTNKELESGIVVITSNRVSGIIDTYDDNSNVVIDGVEYKYAANIIIGDATDAVATIGDYVTFYINARNVICGIDTEETNTNLQYGFATLMAKGIGLDNGMQIRICDTTGAWNTYDFYSRVSVNGNASKSLNDIVWSGTPVDGKYIINDIVAYETRSNGEITKIYFDDSKKFNITSKSGTNTFYNDVNTLGGIGLGVNTTVFSVDSAANLTDEIDEEDITVATRSSLINRQAYGSFTAYNVNTDNIAAVVCGKDLIGAIDYASTFFTISKVVTKNSDEGESGKEIAGIVNGKETTIFVPDTATINELAYTGSKATVGATISDLKKGCVIVYNKNAKNITILVNVDKLYDANGVIKADMLGKTETFTAGGETYTLMYGYVGGKTNSSYYVYNKFVAKENAVSGDALVDPALSMSGVTGTIVNPYIGTNGKVIAGASGDIEWADKSETTPVGDVVFVKVVNDIIVKDFVTFRTYAD